MDCKNFGEIWIVRCLSLVCWKMSNGRLFTLSNIGVGNVFKTTTTTRCAMFWASIVHWPYLHRSCAHMSHVQCPVSYVHCKHCPTLQAMSYIANFVLHCRHCPTLKSQCPEKPYNYLWSASPPAANTSWRGSHSLPAKPLSDIFETFWISSSSQYVWEMFKIPQKCLTRIIQHVTRFSWLWASIYSETVLAFLRLAGLQMVFIQSKPVCSEETIRESLASGKKWMRAPPSYDSMFKYWLW